MSPSLLESIRVGLCPDRLVFARYGRGLRPPLLEKGTLSVDAGVAKEPWQSAAAALQTFLRTHAPRGADGTVVLSNHFVRYALLDANDRLAGREEWLEYASHRFEKIYGPCARDWDVRVADARAAHPRLASAIDRGLINAITLAFKGTRARLRSIQPYLMVAFNQALRVMPQSSFWFVLQEPGRLQLGLVHDGIWRSIRSRQAGARWRDELPQIVERESALRAPEESGREVLVSAFEPVESGSTNGFRFVAPPSRFSGEDRIYEMVCA